MPAKSKSQQRFFGVVKAMQQGDIPKKGEAGKAAKSMTKKMLMILHQQNIKENQKRLNRRLK